MNLRHLRETYRSALLEDILPFWLEHGVDRDEGGFFTALDRDGSLLDSDKSIWFQGRFSWLLATVADRFGGKEEWLASARSGLDFLERHGFDPEDGLMWFTVTRDGRPLRKRRYRFSEAFACLAHAAYFQVSGERVHGEQARSLFETFDRHRKDPSLSPFPPKFTGTRPSKGLAEPMVGLHLAQACREAGIEGVDWNAAIDVGISEIARDFVHEDIECVLETVAVDGSRIDDHFDGRTLNPGHAIEAGWFVLQEAKRRGNDRDLISLGTRMLDWMWRRGWDEEYGGLLYFTSVDGRPVQEYWHDMKFWWPHNEAEIANLLAFQLTGEPRFAECHEQVHEWAWSHFPDPDYGEWFGYLNRNGTVSSPAKGTLWKGPYHIPRMMLTGWEICEEMLAEEGTGEEG